MEFHDLDYFNDKASELYERDSEIGNKVTIDYGDYSLTFYFNKDSRLIVKYKDLELQYSLYRNISSLEKVAKRLYDFQFYLKDYFESKLSESIDRERINKLYDTIMEQSVHIAHLLDTLQHDVQLYDSLYSDSDNELVQKSSLTPLETYLESALQYEKVVK